MAEVTYSIHLNTRIKFRNIPKDLPRQIYLKAARRYWDRHTDLYIAVKKSSLYGKQRNIMIAYKAENQARVKIITIHPPQKTPRRKPNQSRPVAKNLL